MCLEAQFSANARLFVIEGGVVGQLKLIQIDAPVTAGFNTPHFSLGFKGSIETTLLDGKLDWYASVFDCCCWSCGWSCCFSCGGSCNKQIGGNIVQWSGINWPYTWSNTPLCPNDHHTGQRNDTWQLTDVNHSPVAMRSRSLHHASLRASSSNDENSIDNRTLQQSLSDTLEAAHMVI